MLKSYFDVRVWKKAYFNTISCNGATRKFHQYKVALWVIWSLRPRAWSQDQHTLFVIQISLHVNRFIIRHVIELLMNYNTYNYITYIWFFKYVYYFVMCYYNIYNYICIILLICMHIYSYYSSQTVIAGIDFIVLCILYPWYSDKMRGVHKLCITQLRLSPEYFFLCFTYT